MSSAPTRSRIRVSGPRVVAQVRYADVVPARRTAAAIVARKCRNEAALLTKFLPYQRRYPERSAVLVRSVRRLQTLSERLEGAPPTRPAVFLQEAHAARAYWAGVSVLLSQHDPAWKRRYPHARDPTNLLFNTGYTFLTRWVRDAVQGAGLLPEIGVLHAVADGKEPLVYDLMELFRQPAIDAVVIPLLTKKKRLLPRLSDRDIRRAVARFHEQWERPFWYKGQCVPLRQIAERECIALGRAQLRGKPWQPYHHPWGHGWTCVGYRASPNIKKRLRSEAA